MSPQVFIFIGRSGSGKGTQADLITKLLKRRDPGHNVVYIQTGQGFRDFIKGDSLTAREAKKIYDAGDFEPEFLTVHIWSHMLVENYRAGDHVIFDGTPRKFHEAGVLDSILAFYRFEKPFVIHLDIEREESMKRLLLRKRIDDTPLNIEERLNWYDREVKKALEFYNGNPDYHFLNIDGARAVDDIHADIVKKCGLE
jgi:adenylate kinase family enzyme